MEKPSGHKQAGIDAASESPLWSLTAPPAADDAALDHDLDVDIAVVGGGFLGLSTAIHLAEGGANVAVIEAHEPGAGASGRNTGFVIPNFPSPQSPDDAIEAFGPAASEQLIQHVGNAATFAFGLMDRLSIACEQEQLGWAQAAHSTDMLASLTAIAEGWRRFGFPVELLGQEDTAKLLGFAHYPGCMVFRTGGQLNPLAYVRGLARAARNKGVALLTRSPVSSIDRSGTGWAIRCPLATVKAKQVILTVNVATDSLVDTGAPPLRISHMRQAATAPLPAGAPYRGPSLPFSDTAPHPNFALRTTRDGRLVTGGEPDLARQRLAALLPAGQPIEIEYAWGGDTAHTVDLMPRFQESAPGLYVAIGCNGRGVAVTSMFGALVARQLIHPDPAGPFLSAP